MSETAADRLSRLLAMVPWLVNRQGVPLADAAAQFRITEDELVADLELLFVCGTPGHMPDDLIEADWESGKVYLDNADALARPLRLGLDEAMALLVGLRTLADVRGVAGREAVDGALAKLSSAAGEAAASASAVQVDLRTGAAEEILAACRGAVQAHRRLHLRYLGAARDEETARDVDPMRLVSLDGRWYLEGWCHRADDVRLFRLDRVLAATALDQDGTPPPQAVGRDLDSDLFRPSPDDLRVTLELGPRARWVADYYPVESRVEGPGDGLTVQLRTAEPGWLRRLMLRLGGAARVVDPPELARAVAASAQDAVAAYR